MKRDQPGAAAAAWLTGWRVAVVAALATAACGRSSSEPPGEPPAEPSLARPPPLSPGEQQAGAMMRRMTASGQACERARAPEVCAQACDLGHSNSCARAGERLRGSDPAAAARRLDQACAGGSGLGCEGLARLHLEGAGVARDADAAARLLASARAFHRVHCEQGFAPSCLALSELFRRGEGGPASRPAAAHWAAMACRLGERAACAPTR